MSGGWGLLYVIRWDVPSGKWWGGLFDFVWFEKFQRNILPFFTDWLPTLTNP